MKLRPIFAGALAALSLTSAAHADRPFAAKDLATLDRVSNPKLSPDGRYVVYALRAPNGPTGGSLVAGSTNRLTPELKPSQTSNVYIFALP